MKGKILLFLGEYIPLLLLYLDVSRCPPNKFIFGVVANNSSVLSDHLATMQLVSGI